MRRDIGKEILEGLEDIKAWRRSELRLKTTEIYLPKAEDVPGIRKRLGLSEEAFAGFMGVSVGTLRNWEQGRREPQGPARALLLIADKKPAAFRESLMATVTLSRLERGAEARGKEPKTELR